MPRSHKAYKLPNIMSEFITVTEDKFKGKSTYETTKTLNLDGCDYGTLKASLRRLIIMPAEDVLLMDLKIDANNINDWPHMRNGNVIMLVDNETFVLDPVENYFDCETHDGNTTYYESCYYDIGKNLLKKIADSNSFSMKVYGEGWGSEIENTNAFIVYCKLFYNQVYDNAAYVETVNNALAEFQKFNADISSFSKINKDGSNANGGCMGAILLLITLGSALLYAVG